MAINFEPIAWVTQCSFKEKFGTPRQGLLNPYSRAFIKLNPSLPTGSLVGLEGFSHLWLIWVFHSNDNKKIKGKVHAPRLGGASMGVLATRTPHRPNPIGLSAVEIESIESKGIWVRGIDLIEDTPILDIKPYILEDKIEGGRYGWSEEVARPERPIHWHEAAIEQLKHFSPTPEQTKILIEQTLRLDPRPVVYRKLEDTQGYAGPYGLKIEEFNVKFTSDASGFTVVSLELKEF